MMVTMTRRDGIRIEDQGRGNEVSRRDGWMAPRTVSALLFAVGVALAGGCGNASSISPGSDAGTTTPDAAAPTGTIVKGASQPCTEAHSICVNAKFPASMTAQPKKLQIDLYIIVPPMDPPDGIPLAITMPEIQPGETVQLRMTDLGLTGNYHFLGLVFMPGGGSFMPVPAVDYTGDSSTAYPFTGAAMNLPETLDFQYAP